MAQAKKEPEPQKYLRVPKEMESPQTICVLPGLPQYIPKVSRNWISLVRRGVSLGEGKAVKLDLGCQDGWFESGERERLPGSVP